MEYSETAAAKLRRYEEKNKLAKCLIIMLSSVVTEKQVKYRNTSQGVKDYFKYMQEVFIEIKFTN